MTTDTASTIPAPAMPTKIVDTDRCLTAHIPAVVAALGVGGTVVRYIDPIGLGASKTVKAAEAAALGDAGIRLALVCEGWGGTHHQGVDAASGTRDATVCRQHAAEVLGAPSGVCIYFAVDTDLSPEQIQSLAVPYFTAIQAVFADGAAFPAYRIGVYGSGRTCAAMLDAGLADLAWLSESTAWGGSHEFKASGRWALLQGVGSTVIAGEDTDSDVSNGDIGDWLPTTVPVEHDVAWIQRALNAHGADPALVVDGTAGAKTAAALRVFQSAHGLLMGGTADAATIAKLESSTAPTLPAHP